jgi:hypothetical protein
MRTNLRAAFLRLDARRLQQEHKRRRRTVHDRHFRAVDINVDVVDAETRQRRHQVLDRRHRGLTIIQCRAQTRVTHQFSFDDDIDRHRQIDATEHHTRIRRSRAQRHQRRARRCADPRPKHGSGSLMYVAGSCAIIPFDSAHYSANPATL